MWFWGWIICAFASAYVAVNKNKSGGAWFFIGLLLGPIAVLMVGLSPAAPIQEAALASNGLRKCPYCAEDIKAEAIVCKHCGRDIQPVITIKPDISDAYDKLALEFGRGAERTIRSELEKQDFTQYEINEIIEAKRFEKALSHP